MKYFKLLLLVIFVLPSIAFTQEKPSVMATIVSLIKARKNEFVDLKGKFIATDKENSDYYSCSQGFGAKTEALKYGKNNNRSTFLSYFDYSDTDELLKGSAIVDEIAKTINIIAGNSPNAVYKAYDYQTADGIDITEVVDNNNGFLVMRIASGKEIKSLTLTFYSANYGKPNQ
jgi:hypothetical protein